VGNYSKTLDSLPSDVLVNKRIRAMRGNEMQKYIKRIIKKCAERYKQSASMLEKISKSDRVFILSVCILALLVSFVVSGYLCGCYGPLSKDVKKSFTQNFDIIEGNHTIGVLTFHMVYSAKGDITAGRDITVRIEEFYAEHQNKFDINETYYSKIFLLDSKTSDGKPGEFRLPGTFDEKSGFFVFKGDIIVQYPSDGDYRVLVHFPGKKQHTHSFVLDNAIEIAPSIVGVQLQHTVVSITFAWIMFSIGVITILNILIREIWGKM